MTSVLQDFAGICGALMIVLGMVLSAVAGIYVDKTKQFDEVLKVSLSLAVLSGIAFTQVTIVVFRFFIIVFILHQGI